MKEKLKEFIKIKESKKLVKLKNFTNEFRKQSSIAIIAAFGFLIALSWKEFIVEVVDFIVKSFGAVNSVYLYKLIAALMVTLLSIIGIMIISKFNSNEEK